MAVFLNDQSKIIKLLEEMKGQTQTEWVFMMLLNFYQDNSSVGAGATVGQASDSDAAR